MKRIAFIITVFLILFCLNGWHIELEGVEDISVEYTDSVVLKEPTAYLRGKFLCKDGIKINVNTESNFEEGKVGKYNVKNTASFLFLKKEETSLLSIVDSEFPIININSFHDTYFLPGEEYDSFIATDNYDGDLTDKVVIDIKDDAVIYSVKDSYGNETSVTKKLITEDTKIIYLTFDDGPSKYTSELLDVLRKYNVKATFFVVNSYYSDILERMNEEGHAVGLHTYTHEYKNIYKNEGSYFEDLNKIQKVIKDKTGKESNLLRFPGGSSNTISRKVNKGIMTNLTAAVKEKGFEYFDWNVDSNDAGSAKTSEEVYNNVIKGIQGKRIVVVLQHDTKKFSIDAVEKIIEWGLSNGYVFLPLNENSFAAHHGILN